MAPRAFNLKPLSNNSLDELINSIDAFHDQSKKRVLIIEDNEAELQRLSELISNEGIIEVFAAPTAKKALQLLKKELFDCIVMDFVFPDANGLDLLNKINLLKQPQTTIILHSARDFTQDELIQLKAAKSQDHYQNPCFAPLSAGGDVGLDAH